MNVDRVESFRSSLMNQKQRLMKQTQAQNTFDKSTIEKDLKKNEEEKSAKTFIFGALRKISGGSRKSSKEAKTSNCSPPPSPSCLDEKNANLSAREPSPHSLAPPATPTIVTLPRVTATPPNSPVEPARNRTPVPADSPLLTKVRQDPILKRFRSFNRSLKKASSFRQARDRAADLLGKRITPSPKLPPKREVTFRVKKTATGRSGWKIMPEDESLSLKINKDVLNQCLDRLKEMQYSGEAIPDKITITVDTEDHN